MGFRAVEETPNYPIGGVRKNSPQRTPVSYSNRIKRGLDIVASLLILISIAPFMLIIMAIIRIQDGHAAIFKHERIGKDGKTFNCLKLRTMVPDSAERLTKLLAECPKSRLEWNETQKLTNDPRITSLGWFLRQSSIDELPQLLNVLRGEMSLVGPRPIVQSEIERYGRDFEAYKSVKPGITGLWQIKGRSDTSYTSRVKLDVEYAMTQTFLNDLSILLRTVPAVLLGKGAR